MRPEQWTKNLFLFAALVFSGKLLEPNAALRSLNGFFIFCIASGSLYIINDIKDIHQDKKHPVKSKRPIPMGIISPSQAMGGALILLFISLIWAYQLNTVFFSITCIYIFIHFLYTFILKYIVILDVFGIATGFVIRVIAGATTIDVNVSSWLIICTILLSLFLALSKRRHEIVLLEKEAESHRKVLDLYTPYLLDQMISVVTASTLITYSLYTISPETVTKFGTKNLILTIPFVLYGIFRYLYIVHRVGGGGNPEKILLTDTPLLLCITLWGLTAVTIIYWK